MDLRYGPMMEHRSYSGKLLYLTDGQGEMGREWFKVTVQEDGCRTLRALVEMDDDKLLRDVVYTVDAGWKPLDAFVRLTIDDAFVGSGWYRFSDSLVECEAYTAAAGRASYRLPVKSRPQSLGAHPVCCDTWHTAAAFQVSQTPGVVTLPQIAMTSYLPNGGSGPELGTIDLNVEYLGDEEVLVQAGTFETRYFANLRAGAPADKPPVEVWAFSDDFIPARLRWELLKQTYELVELDR